MKKYITFILAAIMALCCLTACGSENTAKTEKLQIVTTIFPTYDWTREILGDELENVELTMLLDSGVDLHNYKPAADDILKISTCDVFIYVGGESDEWVEDALAEAANEDRQVINLLETLGGTVKEEEVVEGMEPEDEEEDGEEETEYDEHVWLSLKNAQVLCNAIAWALGQSDAEHQDTYAANAADYIEKLAALDAQYQTAVDSAQRDTLLFGDRFPFRYLADDYGLRYYAAFVGCSAESEASFETITFLAGKVDELNLHTVLTIEKSDQKIANTIIENTQTKDQQILTMNSMQSVTLEELADGVSYLSMMEDNLHVLHAALN